MRVKVVASLILSCFVFLAWNWSNNTEVTGSVIRTKVGFDDMSADSPIRRKTTTIPTTTVPVQAPTSRNDYYANNEERSKVWIWICVVGFAVIIALIGIVCCVLCHFYA